MEKIVFTEDKLNRKQLAEKYVTVLSKIDNAYTIALDAPWGSGKSKVIDFMCEILNDQKDLYVKYNAWENDYTNEPFLSLLNHIFETIRKNHIPDIKLKKLKSTAIKASKIGAKALVRGIGNFIVGSESVKELEALQKEVTKSFINETSDYGSRIFDGLDESKKSRETFVKELKETINKLLKKTQKDKIYIIIDELDRCKPSFAIELLEHIKHLFEIDEIIFFIAVDNKQLAESLKAVYGNGFDAKTYLHRFFNIELHLDSPNRTTQYIYERLNKLNCHDHRGQDYLSYGYDYFDLTLRDIERIISEVSVIKALNNEDYLFLNRLYPLLILKYKFNDVFLALESSNDHSFENAFKLISMKGNDRLKNFIKDIATSLFDEAIEANFETFKTHTLNMITINQLRMINESSVIL